MNKTVPLRGFGGGGALLNFNVVGGTTEPANPKENTIWVNTDTEITGWTFSATEPTNPIDGIVWIKTGKEGQTNINALKKNGIILYPTSSDQYISGKWVKKGIKVCKNSEWKELYFYLFKEGSGFSDGYTGFTNASHTTSLITMTLVDPGAATSTSNQTVDVTDYSKVTFEGVTASWSGTGAYSHVMKLSVGASSVTIGTGNSTQYPDHVMAKDATFTIDISALSGEQKISGSYVCGDNDKSTATIKIKNIYFS